ncbi:hypothetical protein GDO78_016612 [Eleutherodactylus coqui]|uniref:Uncharacterized protein n=1 Tax=Eleutherodactylus coqui TaxID=57060 RepID=A0A8J6K0L0_ELECQ|nr:hypothetical protein GDO78_016612 [Eleutherodactylus coqui]
MCALEMAVLEIQANGDKVTEENVTKAINSLEDLNMKEFILKCLSVSEEKRPSAHNLLFHRVLFEVHSLKLLSAHCFLNTPYITQDNLLEEKTKLIDPQAVMASVPRKGQSPMLWRYSQVSSMELDKFLEDVRNGIHPLMNFAVSRPHVLPRTLSQTQEDLQTAKTPTPEPVEVETRKVNAP